MAVITKIELPVYISTKLPYFRRINHAISGFNECLTEKIIEPPIILIQLCSGRLFCTYKQKNLLKNKLAKPISKINTNKYYQQSMR